MVDPIGTKPITTTDRRVAPVATSVATAAPTVTPVAATPATAAVTAATTLAQSLAAAPPVDTDRVERIRAAIARGTYPIIPETIADRLLALKLNWTPNEPS